ncbi:MAG: response regulator transcription factor [Nautiliaceae bacterium]
MKIAVLEDEKNLNDALTIYLESEGYEVKSFYSLKEFFSSIKNYQDIDLIIADVLLPDGNFLQELKKYPHLAQNVKVIIISAKTDIENIKKAFNVGAEDFIKKPFDYEEIILRINKIFHLKKQKITDNIYYDFNSKALIKNGRNILLTKKESKLLELFLKNRGQILSPDYLINAIWEEPVPKNTLTVLIKRIREKIGKKGIIISKRDLGYILF